MKHIELMSFIHIGNVGFDANYVYLFCGLVSILILYFCVKSLIIWVVQMKFDRLLIYTISSLFIIAIVSGIDLIVGNEMEVAKIALQSISLFGFLLSIAILIKHFIIN
ncbi:hypothetical protein [Oceanobacillus profundus]|uniref:Uncharacterized protein n=1 Tax=Oceanobacillus profundus TaxID=372463 RepID=A0A417YKJ9_9BACI|nr:hypothetical protein [Oceanobacillus profundus]RHW33808.1 hypothetical protein D1B32_07125 [Oceanobacillus profundus]